VSGSLTHFNTLFGVLVILQITLMMTPTVIETCR